MEQDRPNGDHANIEMLISWKNNEVIPNLKEIYERLNNLEGDYKVMNLKLEDIPEIKKNQESLSQKIDDISKMITQDTSRSKGRIDAWMRVGDIIFRLAAIATILGLIWRMTTS